MLNPPILEKQLPAYIKGSNLIIPFQLNRSVGQADFTHLKLIVKTVQSNTIKISDKLSSLVSQVGESGIYQAVFVPEEGEFDFFQYGQFYKIQLAFCSDTDDGYYSEVGVIKCTSKPTLEIIESGASNKPFMYLGVYNQQNNGDISEKVEQYCFNLYDEEGDMISTTGWCLHNSSTDTSVGKSTDSWYINKTLKPNTVYTIGYSVITINGYQSEEVKKDIQEATLMMPDIGADLAAANNPREGYIEILLLGKQYNYEFTISGKFLLTRASSKDNFEFWEPLTNFELQGWNSLSNITIYKDYTIEQGYYYRYALQVCSSKGIKSNRMINKEGDIYCDFEDAFLYDGQRQLKIRFNPSISSFKATLLETKTNTIGDKYPFIFRNGVVNFKEFQISGLLSFLGDESNQFLEDSFSFNLNTSQEQQINPLKQNESFGTDLTAQNFKKEREFKLTVLDWLNDGKPKLFKSPAEGNYIVRLMNSSLSPNDTLGRMIHTFTSSACEIAEFNFDNLQKYNLISSYVGKTERLLKIQVQNLDEGGVTTIEQPACWIELHANPGTDFQLIFASSFSFSITVGETGVYRIDKEILENNPLVKIHGYSEGGYFIYGYEDDGSLDLFESITNITFEHRVVRMLGLGIDRNILQELENIREQIGEIRYLKITPRFNIKIYLDGDDYRFPNTTKVENWNCNNIYEVYLDKDLTQFKEYRYVDELGNFENADTIDYHFSVSGVTNNQILAQGNFNPKTQGGYIVPINETKISEINLGEGLMADIAYSVKKLNYIIDPLTINTKNNYERIKLVNKQNSINIKQLRRAYEYYLTATEESIEKRGIS